MCTYCLFFFFFFKQKTAYEMRISDWSSDVCSSDLLDLLAEEFDALRFDAFALTPVDRPQGSRYRAFERLFERSGAGAYRHGDQRYLRRRRSEEHTSELQSLMRLSYAVFCLKKKITTNL